MTGALLQIDVQGRARESTGWDQIRSNDQLDLAGAVFRSQIRSPVVYGRLDQPPV
jgi:hypothetical protein